jgi:spore coat protein U-like protein
MDLARAVLAGVALLAAPAFAATSSVTMTVSTTVDTACTVAVDAVNFGTIVVTPTPDIDVVSTVRLRCSLGVAWEVAMLDGSNASGANRRMRRTDGSANYISYRLFRNAAYTQQWRSSPGQTVSGAGTGTLQTLPLYARVLSGQTPLSGAYLDVMTAELRF